MTKKRGPDGDAMTVFAAYGQLMLIVQVVEQHLANLWSFGLVGPNEEATSRNVKRALKRMIHGTHRATATELFKNVEDRLEQDLRDELHRLIAWRDVLAHRYLRERLRRSDLGMAFAEGTHSELLLLTRDFAAAGDALELAIDAEAAELEDDIASMTDEERAELEEVGRRILHEDPV